MPFVATNHPGADRVLHVVEVFEVDEALKVILVIGVIVVIGVFAVRQEQRRRRLLRAWAKSRGFMMHEGSFFSGSRGGWEDVYPAIKLLDRGSKRQTAVHLEGEIDGRTARCLDYRFTTGSGKNRRTHRYSVLVLDAGQQVIPLRIRPEHMFDKVGEFLGLDDIDFESSEFSRKYHVSSSDRKWAYDVIHGETMDFLLKQQGWTIEFGFTEVAVYRSGSLSGSRCQDGLKIAQKMLALIPADVLAQLRGA